DGFRHRSHGAEDASRDAGVRITHEGGENAGALAGEVGQGPDFLTLHELLLPPATGVSHNEQGLSPRFYCRDLTQPGRQKANEVMPPTLRPRRSALYLPGNKSRALEKGKTLPADVLIFDLEDAVGPDAKADSRATVCDAISTGTYRPREVVVRINGLGTDWH